VGTVTFANSCSPAVQETLLQGVARLHSFDYTEGIATFRQVLAMDSSCAVATWGIATLLMSNPLAGVGSSPQGAQQAQAAIAQGRRIGAKTQRERDYIEAVAAYYQDWGTRPEQARQQARADAYQALAAKYPDDEEARIFAALYLGATQDLSDQSYHTYLKAAAMLEPLFARYPDHPGLAHYLIHMYDAPSIAEKGLPAARRYAGIAPGVPHALHMPSHIFTRVGAWTESAATNERSAAAAAAEGDVGEQLHAMDYMTYAYLQLARDDDARRVMAEAARVAVSPSVRFSGPYGAAAIPARYAVERGDWQSAASLKPAPSAYPYAEALTYFARGLGLARSGNAAGAEAEAAQLARLRDTLAAAQNQYWAKEVDVSRMGVAAWAALARGRAEEAVTLMRQAADDEDGREKHIVTPGRILPARELLGDLLLEMKRPAEALVEYQASQRREPGRFRGLLGMARAAAAAGDSVTARRYLAQLLDVAGPNNPRPELALARALVPPQR
jgi:tetratricopeptide (TPR) repeat protein